MSKWQSIKGVFQTFFQISKEDWGEMDHKLLRIASGIIGFAIAAVFWFYLFRHIMPFHF